MKTDIDTIEADITSCQGQIKRLQHTTVECVGFAPAGKVIVTDKIRLESLNGEIDRLNELVGHNSEVARKLHECLQKAGKESISDLIKDKNNSEQRRARYRELINQTIGTWLKVDSFMYDLSNIRTHPRVKGELEKYEPLIPIEEQNIKHLSEVLEEAQAIITDFQPTGLPEIDQPVV